MSISQTTDAEKKKYFKISKNPASYYSTDKVKRLKLEHEAEEKRDRAAANARERIKRAKVLREPVMGGFLAREYGLSRQDLPAACFARELRDKGHVPLGRYVDDSHEVQHMCAVDSASSEHGIAVGCEHPTSRVVKSRDRSVLTSRSLW